MTKDIKQFLVTQKILVKQAMQRLDSSMGKILFVVNAKNQLIGALTDGDVRRWLLRGGSLHANIEKVYNPKPMVYAQGVNQKAIQEAMLANRAECVPIVDAQKRIVDLIFWQEMFGEKQVVTRGKLSLPIVIMAGGKGTRLDPFTRILPKPLIPIGDKTIIEIIIDKFLSHKVKHFFISVNYKASIIKSYFEELNIPYKVSFLHEKEYLGTVGGLKELQGKIPNSFILTNCDTIVDADYHSLVAHHESKKNDVTIVASMMHYTIPYGVCEISKGGLLKKMSEKPEYSFLVNTGMYVIKGKLLKLIPKGKIFHVTELIEKAKKQGAQIGVYPISQRSWIDTGEWAEYKKALERLSI